VSESLARLIRQSATHGLSSVFEEEPVSLDVFVRDKKFMNNPPLSAIQYDAVRHLEQVLYRETYELMAQEWGTYWTPVRNINEATICWGKGSGKDHVIRVSVARVAYILLCLRNPLKYYGMPGQDSIHMLNVASASSQAIRAFFEPLRRALTRKGCWFEDKCSDKEQSIRFHKNIEAISGHSGADTQEGLNLLFGLADEISAFRTREEAARVNRGAREATNTAESILEMMRTSASTRFPDGNWKVAAISYPRYKGDAILRLMAEGKSVEKESGENSRRYISGPFATWDVNPRVHGKEQFADEYRRDPDNARAKYECKPPNAQAAFIRNLDAIGAAFGDVRAIDPVDIRYAWDKRGEDLVPGWQINVKFAPDFRPIAGAKYTIHGDIGISGDRAGVAMSHVKTFESREWLSNDDEGNVWTTAETRPIVKLDFVAAFISDKAAAPQPREVRISWYRELCMLLIGMGYHIAAFTFDGFQSTDSMQMLKAQGIESYRISTETMDDPYRTLRDLIYEGRFEGYYDTNLINELKQLRRTARGKIDHLPGGSKDMADAVACSALAAITVGGSEVDTGETADHRGSVMPMSIGVGELPAGLEYLAETWS
jgi:hypothetical protein